MSISSDLQSLLNQANADLVALNTLITTVEGQTSYMLGRFNGYGNTDVIATDGFYDPLDDRYGESAIPGSQLATFSIALPYAFITTRIEFFFYAKPATSNVNVPPSTLQAANEPGGPLTTLTQRRINVGSTGVVLGEPPDNPPFSLKWTSASPVTLHNVTATFNVKGRLAGDGFIYCKRIEIDGFGTPPIAITS